MSGYLVTHLQADCTDTPRVSKASLESKIRQILSSGYAALEPPRLQVSFEGCEALVEQVW